MHLGKDKGYRMLFHELDGVLASTLLLSLCLLHVIQVTGGDLEDASELKLM